MKQWNYEYISVWVHDRPHSQILDSLLNLFPAVLSGVSVASKLLLTVKDFAKFVLQKNGSRSAVLRDNTYDRVIYGSLVGVSTSRHTSLMWRKGTVTGWIVHLYVWNFSWTMANKRNEEFTVNQQGCRWFPALQRCPVSSTQHMAIREPQNYIASDKCGVQFRPHYTLSVASVYPELWWYSCWLFTTEDKNKPTKSTN